MSVVNKSSQCCEFALSTVVRAPRMARQSSDRYSDVAVLFWPLDCCSSETQDPANALEKTSIVLLQRLLKPSACSQLFVSTTSGVAKVGAIYTCAESVWNLQHQMVGIKAFSASPRLSWAPCAKPKLRTRGCAAVQKETGGAAVAAATEVNILRRRLASPRFSASQYSAA